MFQLTRVRTSPTQPSSRSGRQLRERWRRLTKWTLLRQRPKPTTNQTQINETHVGSGLTEKSQVTSFTNNPQGYVSILGLGNYSIKYEWLLWNRFFTWKISIQKNRLIGVCFEVKHLIISNWFQIVPFPNALTFKVCFYRKRYSYLIWGIDILLGFKTQFRLTQHSIDCAKKLWVRNLCQPTTVN